MDVFMRNVLIRPPCQVLSTVPVVKALNVASVRELCCWGAADQDWINNWLEVIRS